MENMNGEHVSTIVLLFVKAGINVNSHNGFCEEMSLALACCALRKHGGQLVCDFYLNCFVHSAIFFQEACEKT